MTIHKDLIMRLIKYRRVLTYFHSIGMEQVFSNNLGDALGVTAALVRKDMTMIDFHGNRRGGYSVSAMLGHLEIILGNSTENTAVFSRLWKPGPCFAELFQSLFGWCKNCGRIRHRAS